MLILLCAEQKKMNNYDRHQRKYNSRKIKQNNLTTSV